MTFVKVTNAHLAAEPPLPSRAATIAKPKLHMPQYLKSAPRTQPPETVTPLGQFCRLCGQLAGHVDHTCTAEERAQHLESIITQRLSLAITMAGESPSSPRMVFMRRTYDAKVTAIAFITDEQSIPLVQPLVEKLEALLVSLAQGGDTTD